MRLDSWGRPRPDYCARRYPWPDLAGCAPAQAVGAQFPLLATARRSCSGKRRHIGHPRTAGIETSFRVSDVLSNGREAALLGADSEHDARERSTAELDAPSAS
jgi:hypothetical protein